MRAILAALLVLACGPVGVAMAEPPTLTIETPASGSFSTSQTPSFGGASNDSLDDVTLNIYAGANVAPGALVQTLTTLSPPLGGVWSLEPVADLPYGVYTVQATQTNSSAETGTSEPPVTFTVAAAPMLTSEPVDLTVLAGEGASFSAAASGTPAPEVQWEVSTDGGLTWADDTTDAGTATDTLTVASATVAETGNEYRAVFTNVAGTATSAAATLTVNAAPAVTSNPASQGVKVGETATFKAAASGTPAPKVQWQESTDFGSTWTDDTTDSGNTTDTLTVLPTTVAESGHEYRAVFTNVVETVMSEPATLTVFEKPVVSVAPVVTSNPVDQTVLAGEGAVFTAAVSGVPAPEVRWQVSTDSGSTWANDTTDAGNTTDTLAVLHTTVAESGREYRAAFTNVDDTATSKAATLTVDSPPSSAPPAPVVTPAPSTTTTPATSPLSPTPNVASPASAFTWVPSNPAAGEKVALASTSTALASPIAAFAWDLTGNGTFTAGGPVIGTSFATPGDHVVRLRVTAADGLTSIATETIPVSSPPLILMQPFPVVRIAGLESSSGARISLLTVQAPVGATVAVTCRGPGCPTGSEHVVAVARSKGTAAGVVLIAFRRFERSLWAGAILEIRVSERGQIGKYTSFAVRHGKLPARVDTCLSPAGIEPIACPSS
jgi:hypothetical protein